MKFNKTIVNEGEVDKLVKIINENKNRNILVNLTGGSRVNSLTLLNISKDNLLNSIYVDIKISFIYI